ncbi:PREDICTED: uncharacterized protein LOC105453773 [Wasmannia auropunctata]|uniref:uncharacterized protein LOC105453773 n=1 Tax=Wasmannia auropunctata TaxID=64793 RepID=UPI0005EF1694|nr:PREDICTED: uncharacterized protein LOC105453773 [Wasmannia auropunctata]
MKYTIAQSIVMLFLMLDTKPLTEGIEINNYFRLINDVHRYYRTSCVIFVRSDSCDFNTTTLVHMWSREFSRQRVMTMTTTFSDLTSKYNEYQENVTRPLFVVLLDTEDSMNKFAKTTRSIKPISFPVWFVKFLQRPGNPLEKYCLHPTDNVFNVDIHTNMLVLCYNRPILVEWYAVRENRTRTFDLATWSPDGDLILKTRKSLYARRSDMFGEVLRVASVENDEFGEFLSLVLLELSKVMNFTVKILHPAEVYGSWSEQQKIWTGAAFSLDTWIALLMIIIIASFLLTTMKIENGFSMDLMSENYIKIWGIYCQQGLPGFPRESSVRLAFFSIYISAIIILASYSASLISFLALNTPQLSFSTLEGYVKDGTYKLIVLEDSAEYEVLSSTKDPVYLKMYQLLEKKKYLPATQMEGFEKICQGKKNLAFYTTEVAKETNISIQCKVVYIVTGRIDNLGLTLTKGSSFTGFINYHLQRFQLNGVMNKLRNKYHAKDPPNAMTSEIIDLNDITPILTIMIGGMILALFILIIEKMYSLRTQIVSKNNVSKTAQY